MGNNEFKYEDIELKRLSKSTNNGKTIATFRIENVGAERVSGYSITIPSELHDKVKVISPKDILEVTGSYAYTPQDLKNGFTVEVDPSVTNEQIKQVKVTRHYRDKTLALAYSAKDNYRYDENTKRRYIRELVATDKEGFNRTSPHSRHGLGYGQALIKFAKSNNAPIRSIALDLTQSAYAIKTTVGADTYTADGKSISKCDRGCQINSYLHSGSNKIRIPSEGYCYL